MIPFHKIYAWLFKSFSIGEETRLINRLREQWYEKMMIIKRSWVFILYIVYIPLILCILSTASIFIALTQLPNNAEILKWLIVGGNALMTTILVISSFVYIRHFRHTHSHNDKIITNIPALREELQAGDRHFTVFFNWSITNQWLLFLIFLLEIIFIISNLKNFNGHIAILTIDFIIIFLEIHYIRRYRKRMMDLEMDFNVVVQGKIFFVNQKWVLSDTQTLESDKIKTIKSTFPNKLSSFLNVGNIEILTEWDTSYSGYIGTITMYFVKNPVQVVNSMQVLLGEVRSIPPKLREQIRSNNIVNIVKEELVEETHKEQNKKSIDGEEMIDMYAIDTRWKVRDILR